MTDQEAEEMLKMLTAHYKQPVLPIEKFCEAFRTWGRAAKEYLKDHYGIQTESLHLAITKSCLLWRLIYNRQKLRTVKCPVHQGKWSGCSWDFANDKPVCACQNGANITGWLPEPDDRNAAHFDSERNYLSELDDLPKK